MRLSTPDETILGMLAARPQHGYELIERFRSNAELGRVWTMSTSQVYAVLKRLESQGLIAGKEIASAEAPSRTEYRVTEAGRQRLHDWLYSKTPSSAMRRIRVEFLSRVYVARLLNMPIQEIVARQHRACEQQRALFLEAMAHAQTEIERLALELVTGQLEAALDWLERCESELSRT